MFYWKYSQNLIFLINEHSLFVPPAILINYLFICRIRSRKEKIKNLRDVYNHIERENRIKKILYFALNLNESIFSIRGGQDLINVDFIKCLIDSEVGFLDYSRLKKIIHSFYLHERK